MTSIALRFQASVRSSSATARSALLSNDSFAPTNTRTGSLAGFFVTSAICFASGPAATNFAPSWPRLFHVSGEPGPPLRNDDVGACSPRGICWLTRSALPPTTARTAGSTTTSIATTTVATVMTDATRRAAASRTMREETFVRKKRVSPARPRQTRMNRTNTTTATSVEPVGYHHPGPSTSTWRLTSRCQSIVACGKLMTIRAANAMPMRPSSTRRRGFIVTCRPNQRAVAWTRRPSARPRTYPHTPLSAATRPCIHQGRGSSDGVFAMM